MSGPGDINWKRLREEAEAAYAKEAARRRQVGSDATAQAEELAWWARERPDTEPIPIGAQSPAAARAAALVADQAVYVYKGGVLLAKLEPSCIWDLKERPGGLRLQTILKSRSLGHYVPGPAWEPGEWDYVGRGHPGE